MLDLGRYLVDSPKGGYPGKGPLPTNSQEHLQVTKKGHWLKATHLTHLPGGCRRVSSSLKEKWVSDSGPRGNAKAGGRGRARGAALERMRAKRRRGRHWGPAAAREDVRRSTPGPRCQQSPAPPPHLSRPSPWHQPRGPPRDASTRVPASSSSECPLRLPPSCRRAL